MKSLELLQSFFFWVSSDSVSAFSLRVSIFEGLSLPFVASGQAATARGCHKVVTIPWGKGHFCVAEKMLGLQKLPNSIPQGLQLKLLEWKVM